MPGSGQSQGHSLRTCLLRRKDDWMWTCLRQAAPSFPCWAGRQHCGLRFTHLAAPFLRGIVSRRQWVLGTYSRTEGSDPVARELGEERTTALGMEGSHPSELKPIPHLPAARECTHMCYIVLLGAGLFCLRKNICFFLILCFLICSAESQVSGVCILFHFFPFKYLNESGTSDSLQFLQA